MDEIPLAAPGPGEVRLRHTAIGVNYADIHTRNGRYPLPPPAELSRPEGAGVVNAVGDGVDLPWSVTGLHIPAVGTLCRAVLTAKRVP